ncbi:MAG: histone deacetylase [Candidatus Melainabacteria bacterium]|nr:histone deacetylase [Candidatus Melainabacteria bacterium]
MSNPFKPGQPRLVYSAGYNTDLAAYGIDKPFALDRGELVLKKLEQDFGHAIPTLQPEPITDEEILLVHTASYLEALGKDRTWLDIFEFKDDEYKPVHESKLLWTMLDDIRIKSGGTKLACEIALDRQLAANLGGGYHHAFPDRGRGFCVIHDIAIALKVLLSENRIKRAMIIDLDFHQGDGSALIFKDDPNVFTLSVHSKEGWPEDKQQSDLDVEIGEHEADTYLMRTKGAVVHALDRFTPDLVVFVAGSDAYEKDVLPGTRFLNLPLETMWQRDKWVIDTCIDLGVPLAMVFAGGYGPDVWEVHFGAVKHLLIQSGERSSLSGFTQDK